MTARQRLLAAFLVLAIGFIWLLWGAKETAFGGPPPVTCDAEGTCIIPPVTIERAQPTPYVPEVAG